MNHADGIREMAFSRSHKEKPILGKIGEAEKPGGHGCGWVHMPQVLPSIKRVRLIWKEVEYQDV